MSYLFREIKEALKVLDLSDKCNESEIKQAYRNQAKKYHPDINNTPEAIEKFKLAKIACDLLLENYALIEQVNKPVFNQSVFHGSVISFGFEYMHSYTYCRSNVSSTSTW